MKRVTLEPAYILHRRPYRESSALVELITPTYGRLSALAKGVRKSRSALQGILQPFIPLLVSWSGKNELMLLSQVEANGQAKVLKGECLFAGFYINELLMILLQKWDAHPSIYAAYEKTMTTLQGSILEPKTLRAFEKLLLEDLGYGMLPKSAISLHNNFSKECFYRFIPDEGFVLCEGRGVSLANNIFSGECLINIAKEDWQDPKTLQDAKRLIRLILIPLLGARQIHSRQLFMKSEESIKHEE